MQLAVSKSPENCLSNAPRRRLEVAEIRREFENSLNRLKRSRIDIYLIHEPDQFELDDNVREYCETLKREGLIGAFGLAYGRVADGVPEFGSVIQGRYSESLLARNAKQTKIFHGVLRYGWSERRQKLGANGNAGDYLAQVLSAHPETAVVISATLPKQIRQLTKSG